MVSRSAKVHLRWGRDSPYSAELLLYAEHRLKIIYARRDDVSGSASHDPAWTLLLDLYVNTGRGKDVGVTSACVGSGSPSSTALRHLAALSKRKIITYEGDPTDQRRRFVRLSDEGARFVQRNLTAEMAAARKIMSKSQGPNLVAQPREIDSSLDVVTIEIESGQQGSRRAMVVGGVLRCRIIG